MFLKKLLADYFRFTRKDRLGVLVLMALVVLAYLLPLLFASDRDTLKYSLLLPSDTLQSWSGEHEDEDAAAYHPKTREQLVTAETFPFDPNTLNAEGWARLGLKPKTIQTIERYRSKGGRFRKPEDLQKIWGLPPGFWERVQHSVRIEKEEKQDYPALPNFSEKPAKTIISVDVNTADSTRFELLPGIGAKLAARIVSFRARLGGFHSADQVSEVYGIRDSLFQRIRPLLLHSGSVNKIPVNSVTKDVLKEHPYFRWKLANAVVAYREQHGSFRALEDLKKISLITDSLYQKMLPYLKLE